MKTDPAPDPAPATPIDDVSGVDPAASCSPLTVEQVLIALRAMAEQEETTRRCLTGPRDAPDEFTAWYAAEVLREAARLIQANDEMRDRHLEQTPPEKETSK